MIRLPGVLLLPWLALAACDPTPPIDTGPCDPSRVHHVEGFGYIGGAPYLAELAPYSNLSWGSGPGTLTAARAAGIRAVVSVGGVFQIAAKSPPTDATIAANWSAVADLLRPDVASLAALYPADEPYLNGEQNGVALAEIQRRLEAAARLIHATPGFEQVHVATIFSDRCFHLIEAGSAGMPAGYDWVGWDLYYAPLDMLEDHLHRFLALMRPEQRFIVVPDAFLWMSNQDLAGLERRIAFYLQFIETHTQVVAVAPYIYQSGANHLGARDLPTVRARYEQIGSCILTAQP